MLLLDDDSIYIVGRIERGMIFIVSGGQEFPIRGYVAGALLSLVVEWWRGE